MVSAVAGHPIPFCIPKLFRQVFTGDVRPATVLPERALYGAPGAVLPPNGDVSTTYGWARRVLV